MKTLLSCNYSHDHYSSHPHHHRYLIFCFYFCCCSCLLTETLLNFGGVLGTFNTFPFLKGTYLPFEVTAINTATCFINYLIKIFNFYCQNYNAYHYLDSIMDIRCNSAFRCRIQVLHSMMYDDSHVLEAYVS